MFKKIVGAGLVFATAVIIALGVIAYSYLKPVAAASGPIQAIPITQSTATTTPAASGAMAPTSAGTAATSTIYTIDQASSTASFTIDEVLNGAPKTVVGTTNQVAGQIAVSATNPGAARIGTIQINARTLTTDSDQRNNAIKNMILKTNDNEYITFVPTAVTGLPASATAGQSYSFQVVGQLTVAGQAHEATFAVTVTPTADGKLQGTATTIINYADWGVSIPSVPFVTGVEGSVTLALDFVATAS